MKKIVSCLMIALLFALYAPAYSADPQEPQWQEFVSEEQPLVVAMLHATTYFIKLGEGTFSSKEDDRIDYGIQFFVKTRERAEKIIVGHYDLFALSPAKDAEGQLIPKTYNTELVATVFVEEKVAWYKSREVKTLFEEFKKQTEEWLKGQSL